MSQWQRFKTSWLVPRSFATQSMPSSFGTLLACEVANFQDKFANLH